MRKRFITPEPHDASATLPEDELVPQSETTHRYTSHAIAEIRSAIAQARATSDSGESAAEAPATPGKPVSEIVRSWSAELPPMAAAEGQTLTETTQRYADRSVAGIREAIAAARAADPHGNEPRPAARFTLNDTPAVKVPSMILEPRPESAPVDVSADDDDAKGAP